ncbi:MAG: hypothetical protein WD135_00410 [Ferruginibacter sp.]
MNRSQLLFFLFICFSTSLKAQEVLPKITVAQYGNKIIVSWKNDYEQPVAALTIQRSYDSLKNFTTIGSVLNPQNKENGYADANPPYLKMYYRVFVTFEGGTYIISSTETPTKDSLYMYTKPMVRYTWQLVPNPTNKDTIASIPDPVFDAPAAKPNLPVKPTINYPSKWIYTAKDNNVVLQLPEAFTKKYTAVFYDEMDRIIFELYNLKEEYLIIEKANFVRSGWYSFELFDHGKLVEKNKFFVPKDGKISNEPTRKNK